jgi:glycosyltransferase involved in cell wall biosynthesis
MGYVRAELGQGEACRSLLQACVAAQVPFSVTDLGFQTRHPQSDFALLAQAQDQHFAIDLHYVNAPQEAQTAQYLHEQGLGRNRYTIGFWHWEQPQIPVGHWPAFDHLDEVWAPSQFVAQAVADVSPLPVFTVPHAIVCEASTGAQRANFGLPEGRLLVLVMYDFLSYQQRKNPEAAVRAFRMASAQAPEMGLVIKTINGHQHPQALAELKASVSDLPHVFFVDDFLSRQQVWDLQACCDILLSLHRAEGFGLAPAEMMRLGKAVVATGWSANMDFMAEHNSVPVRYTLKPLQQDVGPYPAGPLWAEADEEHAAWCLVQLAQQADWRQRLGQAASHSIRTQLSPQAVGERIAQRLKTLGHWHPKLLAPARFVSRP